MPEETRSANLAVAAFVKVREFLEVILLIQSIILKGNLVKKKPKITNRLLVLWTPSSLSPCEENTYCITALLGLQHFALSGINTNCVNSLQIQFVIH